MVNRIFIKKTGLTEISWRLKPTLLLFSIMIAALICLSPGGAEAEETPKTLFDQGKVYFNSGDFKAAYDTFFTLFKQNPGDLDVNFYLGRSAFEKGDYEAAIMAFERILISQPDATRVKLEIARCHLKLGANEVAKKIFNDVLETNPPDEVKQNIRNLLASVRESEKKHFFSGLISLGVGWDDNAATAPSKTTIYYSQDVVDTSTGLATQLELPTTVDGAESDIIYSHTALLNYQFRVPETWFSWNSTAIIYNSVYTEDGELNINYFSGNTGPAFQSNRFTMDVKGLVYHLLLDGVEYLTAFGASSSASFLFSPHYLTNLSLKWETRNYVGDIPIDKDSSNVNITNGHIIRIGPSTIGLTFAGEKEDAENDENSYDRFETALSYMHQLPYNINASAGYTFQKSDYKEKTFPSYPKRSDKIHTYRAGISKIFWQSDSRKLSLLGALDYTFTDATSNQDLYDYTKNAINLSGTFIF